MVRVLIIGYGYLGAKAGELLQREGIHVTAWVKSPESAREIVSTETEAVCGDVAEDSDWGGVPDSFDWIIHSASSNRGGESVYARVYREGMRQILKRHPGGKVLFVSSTSVYGQTDGGWVSEESPAEPATETGKILVETEREALAAGATVLRASGIYGPGRGVLFQKFMRGEAVIGGDGKRWINQIHRDDLAAALVHLVKLDLRGGIYNVTDSEPVDYLTYYSWLAEKTGKPMPPFGPADPHRKRGLTNKRVSQRKLLGAGWSPRYPTFREGLSGELGG